MSLYIGRSRSNIGILTHIASSIVIGNSSSYDSSAIISAEVYTEFITSLSTIPRELAEEREEKLKEKKEKAEQEEKVKEQKEEKQEQLDKLQENMRKEIEETGVIGVNMDLKV